MSHREYHVGGRYPELLGSGSGNFEMLTPEQFVEAQKIAAANYLERKMRDEEQLQKEKDDYLRQHPETFSVFLRDRDANLKILRDDPNSRIYRTTAKERLLFLLYLTSLLGTAVIWAIFKFGWTLW